MIAFSPWRLDVGLDQNKFSPFNETAGMPSIPKFWKLLNVMEMCSSSQNSRLEPVAG